MVDQVTESQEGLETGAPVVVDADKTVDTPVSPEPVKSADDKPVDDPKKPPHMVPKHRLDYKNRQIEARDRVIEELRGQIANQNQQTEDKPQDSVSDSNPSQNINTKLAALNTEIAKAVSESDGAKVAELQAQSQQLLIDHVANMQQSSSVDIGRVSQQASDNIKLDNMIKLIEAQNAKLNVESDEFDQDLSDEVIEMFDIFNSSGKFTGPQAMAKAYEIVTGSSLDNEDARSTQLNVAKNIEGVNNQSPDLSDAGIDSNKAGVGATIDPNKLTDAEYDALPIDQRRMLRGDFL